MSGKDQGPGGRFFGRLTNQAQMINTAHPKSTEVASNGYMAVGRGYDVDKFADHASENSAGINLTTVRFKMACSRPMFGSLPYSFLLCGRKVSPHAHR